MLISSSGAVGFKTVLGCGEKVKTTDFKLNLMCFDVFERHGIL